MSRHLYLVLKNLRRNRRRSVLTVLSTTVSVFLIGSLISVYAMFFAPESSEVQALRLVTRHRVSLTQALPYFYGSRIAAIDGVEKMSPVNWFGGTYIDQRPKHMFPRFAVDPDAIFEVYPDLTPPPEQLEAFKRDRQGLAVGKSVADKVGLKIGQRITIQGDIYPVDPELTVRAIFEGPDDLQTFFHFKYLEEMQEAVGAESSSQVGVFTLKLRSAADAAPVAEAIDEMFRNSPEPTKTESEAAFQLGFINQLGNIKLFLLSIASAIMFSMLMVTANTVAMSVRERTREIGVLKTLGFQPASVLGIVLGEAMLISLAGGALGTLAAGGYAQAMSNMSIAYLTGFHLPAWGVLACFGTAILLSVGSSLIPATVAARANIVDALRHTG